VLTGHALKDTTTTVAYHTAEGAAFAEALGRRGVRAATFANRPVPVANDPEAIVRAIEGQP
jgi:hypothetical protein